MSLKDWFIFWGSLDHILLIYSLSDPSLYGLLVTWALLSVVYRFPFCMLSDWCISRWTCYVTSWIYLSLFLKWIENLMDWHGMPGMIWHEKACRHTEHYIMAVKYKAIFQSCATLHGCKHVPAVWYTAPNLLPVWTPKPSAWMARWGWIVRFCACCMGGEVGSTTRLPYLIYEPRFSQQSRLEISSLVWTNFRWYSVMNHEVVKTHGL